METIINSFNIFVDTSRGTETGNEAEGDCFLLDLNDTNINTKTGQDIRLTLTNFSMYYVTTNINANNSRFQLRTNLTANDVSRVDHSLDLSHKNYALIRDIGLDFANALKVALLNDLSAGISATYQRLFEWLNNQSIKRQNYDILADIVDYIEDLDENEDITIKNKLFILDKLDLLYYKS